MKHKLISLYIGKGKWITVKDVTDDDVECIHEQNMAEVER